MEPALLLNATYEPIKIISWKKAITLLFLGKVEMLERHDRDIRTMHRSYALPSVVRLTRRVKVTRKPVQFSRHNIYKRDDYTCQYCGKLHGPAQLTFDHVYPRSRGGEKSWMNIVTACQQCNRRKGNRTPEEANMPLLKTPKEPRWSPFSLDGSIGHAPESWQAYLWT